jgi:hypothetical protein
MAAVCTEEVYWKKSFWDRRGNDMNMREGSEAGGGSERR